MYLLLRNNKQSGPLSLEELKTMGLKAYDLVWVEGKSAAWRYPCEIEELKEFAPPVEEQPFDRFYKKSSSPVKANANSSASTVSGKRIIYVTLPSGKVASPVVESRPVASTATSPYEPKPAPVPTPDTAPPQPTYKPASSYASYPVEDYSSQHATEESTLVEFMPRPKKRRENRFVKPLAISLSILALLAAGIFIGLSINKETLPFQQKIASNNEPHSTTQQLPVPAKSNVPAPVTTTEPADSVATILSQPAATEPLVSNSPVTKQKEKQANPQNPKATPLATAAPAKDSATTASFTHREATHRTDPDARTENSDKDAAANRLSIINQVSVGSNGYTVGTFGGITDLQVTVTNHSAYPLDLVVVEVQYIQSNKKIFKTENLYFRGIGAGSALMQEAPKSSRGIKVQYKITTINSKDLGLVDAGT